MSTFERVLGNTIAFLLLALVLWSFLYTFLTFAFGNYRGTTLHGIRGEFYLSE